MVTHRLVPYVVTNLALVKLVLISALNRVSCVDHFPHMRSTCCQCQVLFFGAALEATKLVITNSKFKAIKEKKWLSLRCKQWQLPESTKE